MNPDFCLQELLFVATRSVEVVAQALGILWRLTFPWHCQTYIKSTGRVLQ